MSSVDSAAKPVRQAACFLRKGATADQVLTALNGYAPMKGVTFAKSSDGKTFRASVPGLDLIVTAISRMALLIAEVNAVGKRLEELRTCSLVLTVDYVLDAAGYEGTMFGAMGGGDGRPALPGELLGTCEALNINLAAHRPITHDRGLGRAA